MKSGIVIPSEIQHKSVLYGAQSFDSFFQIKAVNDDKGIIQAYASKFDNVDEYKDVVLKGAYLRTLKNQRESKRKYLYVYLFQHDPNLIVGGIQGAEEDKFGLLYQAQCNLETQLGRETYSNAKMGVLYQSSIGYDVPAGGAEYKDGIRYLKEIRLWEISLVTFAANPEATVLDVKQSQIATPYEIQPTPLEESQRELNGAELQPQATITSVKCIPDEDENASLETSREEKSFLANYQEYVAMDFWEDWHCLLVSALSRSVCDAFLGPDPLFDMQETLSQFSRAAMQWATSAQAAGLQGYLQEMTATFNSNYEEMSTHRDFARKAGRTFSAANTDRIATHAKGLHGMADKAMAAMDEHCKAIRAAADDLASVLPMATEEETDEKNAEQPKDEKAVSLDLAHGATPHSEASTVDERELEAFLQDLRSLVTSAR